MAYVQILHLFLPTIVPFDLFYLTSEASICLFHSQSELYIFKAQDVFPVRDLSIFFLIMFSRVKSFLLTELAHSITGRIAIFVRTSLS